MRQKWGPVTWWISSCQPLPLTLSAPTHTQPSVPYKSPRGRKAVSHSWQSGHFVVNAECGQFAHLEYEIRSVCYQTDLLCVWMNLLSSPVWSYDEPPSSWCFAEIRRQMQWWALNDSSHAHYKHWQRGSHLWTFFPPFKVFAIESPQMCWTWV